MCVVISSVEGDVSGYCYFSQESRSRVPVGCVPKGDERADATALITLHCTVSYCTDHIALHCIVLY